jgi:hypothetical protein
MYRLEDRERGARVDKFAFPHCATLEQNLRFRVIRNLNRITRCLLPSVVKDHRSGQQFPIGTSPRPAERKVDLEPTLRESV